jgi:hypothetical protein
MPAGDLRFTIFNAFASFGGGCFALTEFRRPPLPARRPSISKRYRGRRHCDTNYLPRMI